MTVLPLDCKKKKLFATILLIQMVIKNIQHKITFLSLGICKHYNGDSSTGF